MLRASVSPSRRAARLAVLIAWMLVLTYWSDQQVLPIDLPQIRLVFLNLQHRIAHLIAFGMLGLLGGWAFNDMPRQRLIGIVITSTFGATDEFHQSFVPGRRAGIDDWAFDTFSAAFALYLWPRLERWRPQFRPMRPVLVGAVFAVAVILLVFPSLSRVVASG
jgi:VanZ family protein